MAVPPAAPLAGPPEKVFLLINPKAGGMKGEEILRRVPPYFQVSLGNGRSAVLCSFSLTADGPRGKQACFAEMRGMLRGGKGPRIRVIAAGGDGTIKWVVAEAQNNGVNPSEDLLFGILPLGTGNDFSRSTGWGGGFPRTLLHGNLENLAALVCRWCVASDRLHDVWRVEIGVDEERGSISSVGGNKRRADINSKRITETMIMYFSIGADAKVGIGFDKHRTSSRLCNFCVYMWEGLKKMLPCRKKHRVADVVDGLHRGLDSSAPVIFDTDAASSAPKLLSTPQILVFINIGSFGGGSAHLWSAASRPGVDRTEGGDEDLLTLGQDPGDGRLEVVTVRNLQTVVLDPLSRRLPFMGPRRICSCTAPLYLRFSEGDEEQEEEICSYCQVDGEYFKLVNPAEALVTNVLRIRVLYNEDNSYYATSDGESGSASDGSDEESPRVWWWPFGLEPRYSKAPLEARR